MQKLDLLKYVALICLFLTISWTPQWGYSQVEVNIGLGTIRMIIHEINRPEGTSSLIYPQEYSVYGSMGCVIGYGFVIAARDFEAKWYYPNGLKDILKPNFGWTYVGDGNPPVTIPYFALDATSYYYQDMNYTTVPVKIDRYWLYHLPHRIVDNTDYSLTEWTAVDHVNDNLICEQQVVAACNTSIGISFTQRAYAFSNPNYDDFVIVEYIYKNTGNIDGDDEIEYPNNHVKQCYLGLKFIPKPSGLTGRIVSNSGGWDEGSDDWIDYYGKSYADWDAGGVGDSLRVMYGWDGDATDFYCTTDDEGDPLPASGIFMSPQYPGMAILHADKAVDDHTDDPTQPELSYYSWGGTRAMDILSVYNTTMGQEGIWNIMNNGGHFPSPFDWDTWYTTKTEVWDPQTGFNGNPNAEYFKTGTMGFGPYEFSNIGDSIRIVACYTVGRISWAEAIELGKQWKNKSISETDKNWTLRKGRELLFARISQVRSLFRKTDGTYDVSLTKGYTIDQKIANPPMWPDVTIISEIGGIKLEWSDVSADSYKVYRRLKPEFFLEDPGTETYPCVYKGAGNVLEWTDTNVTSGQHYWYSVTAVKNGIETSLFVNRTSPSESDPLEESASPYAVPPMTLTDVCVVPNPYHIHATRLYNWTQDMINFVGLPASCRIRVYTQTGDLVATIDHKLTTPPSSVESWLQMTESDQYIASGLYFYVIDQTKDHNDKELGLTKIGKFSVIR